MIKDYFLIVFRNFARRKLRGWLTILGIFIGIAAVVALVSLSQGMQASISEQFEKAGKDRIIITAGSFKLGPMGAEMSAAKLTEKDVNTVRGVRSVDAASGVLQKTAKLEFNNEVKYVTVMAAPTDQESRDVIEKVGFFDIEKGRHAKKGYEADVGNKIAYDLFDKDIRVGSKILIEDIGFKVVGIRKKSGMGMHDIVIKMPLDTARDVFEEPEKLSTIFAIAKAEDNPADVAEDIKKELRKTRDVEEGEEDFTVQTAEKLAETFKIILSAVQVILIGIAAISLLVGGVGIMNTMYTSVLERTREIGIMKAIGAKNKDVITIFLIESGLLGLAGGGIGIALGIGIGKIAELIAATAGVTLKAAITLPLIVGVLVFSFFVGSIAGVLPARRAAKLKPVEALRKR